MAAAIAAPAASLPKSRRVISFACERIIGAFAGRQQLSCTASVNLAEPLPIATASARHLHQKFNYIKVLRNARGGRRA
jgi:hypothetical protein